MKEIKNILVTGCGGDIGQSIGKILRMEYKKIKLIGCDVHNKHAGIFIFDKCEIVPYANSPGYIESIKDLIKEYKPDIILPISEEELSYFYKNRIDKINGIPLIIPNFEAMKIGNNKLLTQEFLKKNDLPYAWTSIASDGKPKDFPCILKNIYGKGSKGLRIINEENYNKYEKYGDNFIFQEYLLPDDKEYTCGVFRSKTGEIRTLTLNRFLLNGYTNYGEVTKNDEISKLLELIAEKINLTGSINVQLRLTDKKGPVVFEINSRFSSTSLFRYMLGFKDVIWSIDDYFGKKLASYEKALPGVKIYKGWQEYIQFKDGEKTTIDNIDFKIKKI